MKNDPLLKASELSYAESGLRKVELVGSDC